MPYKTEKIAIDDPFLDRRTKLLPCQREMIKYWRERGCSTRTLARMFSVDRRNIQFVLDPEKLKRNKEVRAARGGSAIYYDREYQTAAMREHRRRKHKLFKDGTASH